MEPEFGGRAELDRSRRAEREYEQGEGGQPRPGALPVPRAQGQTPREAERRERAPLEGGHDRAEGQDDRQVDHVVQHVRDRIVGAVEHRA